MLVNVAVRAELVVPTGWLPKVKLVVESVATGAVPTPVPLRGTVCGLPAALSVMTTEAARLPAETGAKVTLIVQFPPAAREVPQVLVCAKSPALVPLIAMEIEFRAAVPVLLSVTACAALVVPMF